MIINRMIFKADWFIQFFCFFYIIDGSYGIFSNYGDTDIFDFGTNRGVVAFSTTGSIGVLEKVVTVLIRLPLCHTLTFVRVEVSNRISPPVVKLDADLLKVTIKYRPLQHSRSQYVVIAKALPKPDCDLQAKTSDFN